MCERQVKHAYTIQTEATGRKLLLIAAHMEHRHTKSISILQNVADEWICNIDV